MVFHDLKFLEIILKNRRNLYLILGGFSLLGSILSILQIFGIKIQNYIYIGTIASICFLVVALYLNNKEDQRKRKFLNIALIEDESWWQLAKQEDGRFVTQFLIILSLNNTSDNSISIIKSRLIKPKPGGKVISCKVSLPQEQEGRVYYSDEHKVPSQSTVKASLHILTAGILDQEKKNLRVTVGITDQANTEYKSKGTIKST